MMQRGINLGALLSMSLIAIGCSKVDQAQHSTGPVFSYKKGNPTVVLSERDDAHANTPAANAVKKISPTESLDEGIKELKEQSKIEATVRIAILYYLDSPAHRESVVDMLNEIGATVLFEESALGYLDAEMSWDALTKLQKKAQSGSFLLDDSVYKVEIDSVFAMPAKSKTPQRPDATANSSFEGPVHDAGYGTALKELRDEFAKDFPENPSLQGEGLTVAVFDSAIDLHRSDVYDTRLKSYILSDEDGWIRDYEWADVASFLSAEQKTELPSELQPLKDNATLRFYELKESDYDFNNNRQTDSLTIANYKREDGQWVIRLRPHRRLSFGDELLTVNEAHKQKVIQTLDPRTGKSYQRSENSSGDHAIGFILRASKASEQTQPQLRLVGWGGGDHGIANLHMVGGRYKRGQSEFNGVATQVDFIAVQPWSEGRYGRSWMALSRAMIESVQQGADILDLDIYTPGSRNSEDLLSRLLCRITVTTDVIPIVAAHNFGPLPSTVQNMAQSPCVLTIGASYTVAASKEGYSKPSTDPKLKNSESVWTTEYSGRGFGMNGTLKPDIITPAYAYTAYGSEFIRFGGTSGATPATSGLVALLQQAALAQLNRKLDFNQMKDVLQSAANTETEGRFRDGWGFTNVLKAYKLIREKKIPSTLILQGQQNLQFRSRPVNKLYSLYLTRQAFEDQNNQVEPMEFKIIYGGASFHKKQKWIQFYNRNTGVSSDTLDWDAPMGGESETLSLQFNLNDAEWAQLPVGDNLALVVGYRKSKLNSPHSAPDFIQPVSLSKGITSPTHTEILKDFYVTQYRILEFATEAGDVLLLSGQAICKGKTHNTSSASSFISDALTLVVDNESQYVNGSYVMNTYSPIKLTTTQIRIVARDSVTRIAILRGREYGCQGAIDAQINVQKVSLKLDHKITSLKPLDSDIEVQGQLTWSLNSDPYNQKEISTSHSLSPSLGKMRVVLRKHVSEKLEMPLSNEVQIAKLLSVKGDTYPGVLAIKGEEGYWANSSSDDQGLHHRGLEVSNFNQDDQFLGVSLRGLSKGSTLIVTPTQDSILELTLDGSVSAEVELLSNTAYRAVLHSDSKKILEGLDKTWKATLEIELIWTQGPKTGITGARAVDAPTVSKTITIPLALAP